MIWLPDEKHPEYVRSCGAVSRVERTWPPSQPTEHQAGSQGRTARSVALLVLAGPTPEERAKGIIDPYSAESTFGKDQGRLADYLKGVRITGSRAVLDFSPAAMSWLNGPACVQESVKTPLFRTLAQEFGVTEVEYAINGVLVTEWDA